MGCFSKTIKFDVSSLVDLTIYAVDITPIRWQEKKNKIQPVTCGEAKVREIVEKKVDCTPCPDASTISCGESIPTPTGNPCDEICEGLGTLDDCDSGLICIEGSCSST